MAATIAFAVCPFFVPFDGFEPRDYPDPQFNPPILPAGYAFSIWGVIYLWLVLSAVFGLFKRRDDPAWDSARAPLIASVAVGAIWLPVAEWSPLAATALIWVMLLFALLALVRTPLTDRFLLRAPVALYAGWLLAASCVSVALSGAGYRLTDGALSPSTWAIIAITAAGLMSAALLVHVPAIPEFAAAVIWALLAICLNATQDATQVALFAGLAAMLLTLIVFSGACASPRRTEE